VWEEAEFGKREDDCTRFPSTFLQILEATIMASCMPSEERQVVIGALGGIAANRV
jgi:hypothetical protein